MAFSNQQLLVMAAVVVLLALLLFLWLRGRGGDGLQRVLNAVGFERIDGIVLPNADDGEIQIDHLLLTARGLLVLHIKEAEGKIFGSNKMQDWTVIASDRRYTFANPQPALYDRIAAVRQVVRDVPVTGRILFLDGAEFTKGVPEYVTTLAELEAEFAETDSTAARRKIEAFKPYWEQLKGQ